MKYSRDNICEMHNIHCVEADTPEEAAKLFKRQMKDAIIASYDSNSIPKYISLKEVDYIPELWSEELHFYSEDNKEYDSDGKEVPDFLFSDYNESKNGFIWGIKSEDDLTDCESNSYTMNDIDITYSGNKYHLSIEEIYLFESKLDQINYLKSLSYNLKEFVLSKGYSKEDVDNLYECSAFSDYFPSSIMKSITIFEAYTLIDLYRKFKLFAIGYEAIIKHCEKEMR